MTASAEQPILIIGYASALLGLEAESRSIDFAKIEGGAESVIAVTRRPNVLYGSAWRCCSFFSQ
ncbi:MAG: hypothetical protein ACLQE9_00165 [Roseiarcus sp.]